MQRHLELVKVEPVPGLARAEIVVVVASGEAERVKLAGWVEQQSAG